jgi:hypothetical protein
MIAATNGNFNVVNDPVYRQCIAAALRAAADQISYENELGLTAFGGHVQAQDQLLAISAELEGL